MKRFIGLVLLFFTITYSQAQKISINTALQSIVSSNEKVPFWLLANQNGRYKNERTTEYLNVTGLFQQDLFENRQVKLTLGADLMAAYNSTFSLEANQLFAKIFYKGWQLEGGWFAENNYINGISSTNGNIDRSNNARPYPKIRFGTDEFIPILFWKNWLSFKAEYDEGWLNEERPVQGTRLHHKSLFAKASFNSNSSLSMGLNHYVMWGGISPNPNIGQMPESFKAYLLYITGSPGNADFPQTDIANVAGNQFGSYRIEYIQQLENIKITAYLNHPFDDHSGMEFVNLPDNLYGLFFEFKQGKLVKSLVYEHLYTMNQSGPIHQLGQTGMDDYFNHGVYTYGYTFKGFTMASPFFGPINYNLKRIIENTRMKMHHLGVEGQFTDRLSWNAKLSFTEYYGTFFYQYAEKKNQFSSLLSLAYQSKKLPFDVSLDVAADFGQLYNNRMGGKLSISKTF